MRTQVDSEASSGKLSWRSAADLRSQLDQVDSMLSQYIANQGGLTNDQTQHLVDTLTNVTTQLDNFIAGGPTGGSSFGPGSSYNDFLTRHANLLARINQAESAGQINAVEANRLRSEAQLLRRQAERGRYSNRGRWQFAFAGRRLFALEERLNRAIGYGPGYRWY